MLKALVLGFLLGYAGTIPAAGPLALLVAAAALEGQRGRLLSLSVGGAVAEGLWAMGAASGLGWVVEAHPDIAVAMRWVGVVLAMVIGGVLVGAPMREMAMGRGEARAGSTVVLGFVLVALNPSFLLSWLSSCAVLRAHPALASAATGAGAPFLGAGAALGVVGWFLTLGALVQRHREALAAWRRWLYRGLGWAMLLVGVWGGARLLRLPGRYVRCRMRPSCAVEATSAPC